MAEPIEGTDPSQRRWILAYIFGLVCVQGFTINLMPLLFGTMARTFDLSLRQQGQLQTSFLAGGFVALLVSGYITEIIAAKRSGILAILLQGGGAVLLGFSSSYPLVLMSAVVIGLGNQWILAVYSAAITAHFADNRQRMFMWTGAVFAGSAVVSPYVIGHLLRTVPEWQVIFLVFGVFLWIWLAILLAIAGRHLDVIGKGRRRASPAPGPPSVSLLDKLRAARSFLTLGLFNQPALWLLGLIVIIDNLVAMNIISWTPRFFQLQSELDEAQAGLLLSASAAGVALGRLFLGAFVAGRVSDRKLLALCYGGGMVMYALILSGPSYPIALLLMGLNGAFLSAQAPTVYSLASAKFGYRAATAIPLTDAIGTTGGMIGPTLTGFLADRAGLRAVLYFVPVLGLLLVAVVITWEVYEQRRGFPAPEELR